MTDVIRHSIIYRAGRRIAAKWGESFFGNIFTRDNEDINIKSSGVYRLFTLLLKLLCCLSERLSGRLDALIKGSAVISALVSLGNRAATYFKGSLICRLIERLFECEFEFSGLKLYRLTVYFVIFIAPIAPTMVCAFFAAAAFVLYIIDCIRCKSFPVKLDALGFLVFALIIIFGFYAVSSLAPVSSIKIWLLYTCFMLFFFSVINTATSKDKLCKLASVMVFSGLFVSLLGIYQNFFGSNIGHAWLDDSMFEQITVRVYSTLENPNVLGEYLLLMIPVCAALLLTRKTLISRLYYTGTLGAMLLCMLFTQSRGCWLGLLLAAAVFAVFTDWRLVLLGVAALFVLPFVMPESVITRFTSIGNINDSSTSYRLYIWLGTLKMLRDFGIYGIGLGSGAFNKIYPFYSYSTIHAPHAHNIYLQLLSETGIVGLGTFLVFMAVSFKKMLLSRISYGKTFGGIFSVAVMAALIGFMLQGAFDYVWYNYRVFLIFWTVAALGISVGKDMKSL